jgi:hypothetical protein
MRSLAAHQLCPLTETPAPMYLTSVIRGVPLAAAMLVSAGFATACAPTRNVYDSSYNDNHRWDRREDAAYRRWEAEQHLRHIAYEQRVVDEQRAYWTWRHEHPDDRR